MKSYLRRLVAFAVVISALSSQSVAAAPVCEALFQTHVSQAADPTADGDATGGALDLGVGKPQPASKSFQLARSLLQLIHPEPFSRARFTERQAFYRDHLEAITRNDVSFVIPNRAEDRLALFEALSARDGLGLDGIADWVDGSKSRDLNRLAKALNKKRWDKGWRESEAEMLFSKLYLMSHVDPRAWRQIISRPLPETFDHLIRERAEMEFGRTDFVTALDNLGMIRAPDRIQAVKQWSLRNAPLLEVARTIGVNALTFGIIGLALRAPNARELMNRPQFSAETLEILRTQGWEVARPRLAKEAGVKPQTEIALSIGSRVMGAAMMAIAVAYLAPMVLRAVVPPGYADDDGFLALIADAARYWFGVARDVVEPGAPPEPVVGAAARNASSLRELLGDLDSPTTSTKSKSP